jgi:hypothetical protein
MLTLFQLFNLIAKADASTTIKLAKDSKAVALAARHDSSSMKAIAIMTMAFVPGTFFATLFAVPLLKLDSTLVVQDGFWVYWALTLPCRFLIFFVWWVSNIHQKIRERRNSRC